MSGFDAYQKWPHLFDGLDERQIELIVETLANEYLEGYDPTTEDVKDLIAHLPTLN